MKNIARKLAAQFFDERGFTLMELVIVLLTSSIILAATLPLFKVQTQSYVDTREGKKLLQEARIGFNRLVAELQQIPASTEIDWATSSGIQFDLPDQGLWNIDYQVDQGSLERVNTRLVDGVKSFGLRYYRADGSELNPPFSFSDEVWRIQIELKAGNDEHQVVLRSQVSPRNFHF